MLIRVIAGALIGVLPGLLSLLMSLLSSNDDASTRMFPSLILIAIGGYVGVLYGASMRQ